MDNNQQSKQAQKGFLTETTSIWLIGIGIATLACLGIIFLCFSGSVFSSSQIDSEKFDHFGSIIGGLVGAIWSLAGVILFYIALKEQKKATETGLEGLNKQAESILIQQNEYELQRQELEQTRAVFIEQSLTLKKQQFESTYFNLLNLHHQIVNSIDVIKIEYKYKSGNARETYSVFTVSREMPKEIEKNLLSRDCFEYFYEVFKHDFIKEKAAGHDITATIDNSCRKLYASFQSDLGHYFRNLYNILKFIDKRSPDEVFFYSNLLRAQLSSHELLLLFYNSLSWLGREKFKPLIEKYHFLQNMPKEPLIDKEHLKLYDEKAYGKPNEQ